jgi:hypothetical protein
VKWIQVAQNRNQWETRWAAERVSACRNCCSSMSNSLSSMSAAAAGSCLQQREHSSYPYMFHDPLHSLSSTYNHTAARAAAVSNPAVAHSQSAINTHATYGGVSTASTPATGTGKISDEWDSPGGGGGGNSRKSKLRARFEVLTAGSMKMAVFRVVAPSSLVEVYRRFRGICCLHRHTPLWWWWQ